jgi:adenine-specific DNA methylase
MNILTTAQLRKLMTKINIKNRSKITTKIEMIEALTNAANNDEYIYLYIFKKLEKERSKSKHLRKEQLDDMRILKRLEKLTGRRYVDGMTDEDKYGTTLIIKQLVSLPSPPKYI